MAEAAKQLVSEETYGEDAYQLDPLNDQYSYSYIASNGCEMEIQFARAANDQIIKDVLSILLHEAYREE